MRDKIVKMLLAIIFVVIVLVVLLSPVVMDCVVCYKSNGQTCESKAFCDFPSYSVLKELEDNGWSCGWR